jgi:hypothetical protein
MVFAVIGIAMIDIVLAVMNTTVRLWISMLTV